MTTTRRNFLTSLVIAGAGFSTHQGFLSPDKEFRDENIKKTIHQIELAYKLGIPTMRLNTGRWGTIKSFDVLMEKKGIEPRLEGYSDDDGFKWVIDSICPVCNACTGKDIFWRREMVHPGY